MLYNKNQIRKTNDKKVLHKVKKHWTVVSLSLLMAIGGIAAANRSVHAADNTSQNNQDNMTEVDPGNNYEQLADNQQGNNISQTENNYSQDAHQTNSLVTPQNVQNNEEDASLDAEINSLEAPANVDQLPSSSASINSHPASSSMTISYVEGNGGSAASYYAKIDPDQSTATSTSEQVQSYVASINSDFGPQINSLRSTYNSYRDQLKGTQSQADYYYKIVNNSNYSQELQSIAAKSGMNTSDYVQFMSDQSSSYSNAVSSAAHFNNEMSTVYSDALLIQDVQNNPGLRTSYAIDLQSAQDNLSVVNAEYGFNEEIVSALDSDLSNTTSIFVNNEKLAGSNSMAEALANLHSITDSATLSSLASSLDFNNNYWPVANQLNSYASSLASQGISSSNDLYLSTANNNGSSIVNFASGSNQLLLRDAIAQAGYQSNSVKYSEAIQSASSAQSSLSAALSQSQATKSNGSGFLSSAESAVNFYSMMADPNVNLTNLFNQSENDSTTIINEIINKTLNRDTSMSLGVSSAASATESAFSGLGISGLSNLNNNNLLSQIVKAQSGVNLSFKSYTGSDIQEDASSAANKLNGFKAGLPSSMRLDSFISEAIQRNIISSSSPLVTLAETMESADPDLSSTSFSVGTFQSGLASLGSSGNTSASTAASKLADAFSAINNGVSEVDSTVSSAASKAGVSVTTPYTSTQTGLLDPNSYADASMAISSFENPDSSAMSSNLSGISSVASSVEAMYNNQVNASKAYDSSSAVMFARAGDLLASYDIIANNEAASVSSASNALDQFTDEHASGLTHVKSLASSASSAVYKDKQLATAYGMNVYNHAPKFITILKNQSFNYNSDITVPKGFQIHVNGVRFDQNGNVSYGVTYKGQNGYIKADPRYNEASYLFATPNNHVTIKVIKGLEEYNSSAFSKKAALTPIKVGQILKGTVVSEDRAYGGFTRIHLDNGHYITANTKYVKIVPDNNGKSSNNNVTPPMAKVSFD